MKVLNRYGDEVLASSTSPVAKNYDRGGTYAPLALPLSQTAAGAALACPAL
jgi:hypothetical protein